MELLEQVESYLARTRMPPSRFGRLALGDPRLVGDLRSGRRLRPGTQDQLEQYLAHEIERIEGGGKKTAAPHAS
ncbi:hypothetical protein ENE74_17520 [Sphingobium algorifonticola]|uniref:Transcriptional regulator n=1 Tax=Sphingobium algorifonticola TaxID=2008318 RepID=A0A437J2Q0_9SPHN|nr:hypothetical protein [Sphingobium algorifonticola]RVT38495.1 hypothetical protein ENE74_17520 [Sphingobium algorifonticola]